MTKKERTQKEILEAAKEIICEKGVEAITVRHLAEITGYSFTNLYYYFKDVNSLLWTLRLNMIEDMIVEITSTSFTKDDPVEEIMGVFFFYTDYFFKHPNVFRFFYFYSFIQPEGDDRYKILEQKLQSIWQVTFSRLIKEEILQAEAIEVVAKTIIYSLHGMIMLSLSSNGSTNKEDIKIELGKLINYLIKEN
ncbi:MAG: TetR/AcrR family transcriptional regulator [Eubacteriaceae bacterium]